MILRDFIEAVNTTGTGLLFVVFVTAVILAVIYYIGKEESVWGCISVFIAGAALIVFFIAILWGIGILVKEITKSPSFNFTQTPPVISGER